MPSRIIQTLSRTGFALLPFLSSAVQASDTRPAPDRSLAQAPSPLGIDRLKPIGRFLLVEGKLWADVYSHTLDTIQGPLPCWTYASVGLASVGQKEMLLTVKREPGEGEMAFDRFLPNLFKTFYTYAQKGQTVDVGSITQLNPGGTPLLGRPDLLGLIYTAPQALKGIEVTPEHLAVILVTERELKQGVRLGLTRVLSRLGDATRYYPVPPWADRNRKEVCASDEEELKSLVARVPRIAVPGVRAHIENQAPAPGMPLKVAPPPGSTMLTTLPTGRVVLTVTPRAASGLRKAVSESRTPDMLCLHLEVGPTADSCLVWRTGDTSQRIISEPGSLGERVAGNFLLLLGAQEANLMRVVEDGYSVLLTPKDWEQVREALASGQDFTLARQGDMPELVIRWIK